MRSFYEPYNLSPKATGVYETTSTPTGAGIASSPIATGCNAGGNLLSNLENPSNVVGPNKFKKLNPVFK
jgi:hypothetical protein